MGDIQRFDESDFLLYTSPDGQVHVRCRLEGETVWLTQDMIAELFGVQRPAITKHLKNIFQSGELQEEVVSSIMEQTTRHGAIEGKTQTRTVKFYNLDAIISVGYPVLDDPGKVSALEAKLKAESEYEVFRKQQDADYISDFDKEIKRLEGK